MCVCARAHVCVCAHAHVTSYLSMCVCLSVCLHMYVTLVLIQAFTTIPYIHLVYYYDSALNMKHKIIMAYLPV